MKITEISKTDDMYFVTLTPNRVERFFGYTEKTERFKATKNGWFTSESLKYDNPTAIGTVYVNHLGEKLGANSSIGNAIDNWERRFK